MSVHHHTSVVQEEGVKTYQDHIDVCATMDLKWSPQMATPIAQVKSHTTYLFDHYYLFYVN